MAKVPDFLPSDSDLGAPREPTQIVNEMVHEIAVVISRYNGAVDEAQVIGALFLLIHEAAMMSYMRGPDGGSR